MESSRQNGRRESGTEEEGRGKRQGIHQVHGGREKAGDGQNVQQRPRRPTPTSMNKETKRNKEGDGDGERGEVKVLY